MKRIVVVGAHGAIGSALVDVFAERYPDATCYACARNTAQSRLAVPISIDYGHEASIEQAARKVASDGPIDALWIATWILHTPLHSPEKSYKQIDSKYMQDVLYANTVVPALIAKYFFSHMQTKQPAWVVMLSARVGSISDNRLGGWHAYRASKAALNMLIKTWAIELARTHVQAVCVGMHPGTVESNLSKPFQKTTSRYFTPMYAANRLVDTALSLNPQASGNLYAYDGTQIAP